MVAAFAMKQAFHKQTFAMKASKRATKQHPNKKGTYAFAQSIESAPDV
jgi:hypothetical protein